ncbi:hypothetical protein PF011_g30508 [Phytophthora fragariae]|uniref:RxLR effector protein n=1 Tax=Phytophthora fragariae TaxID=53985 RepID=A0A6A3GPN5_9STRA|nr:hypothetical protein PF011_g30508 [Phytophthora fragariae]
MVSSLRIVVASAVALLTFVQPATALKRSQEQTSLKNAPSVKLHVTWNMACYSKAQVDEAAQSLRVRRVRYARSIRQQRQCAIRRLRHVRRRRQKNHI